MTLSPGIMGSASELCQGCSSARPSSFPATIRAVSKLADLRIAKGMTQAQLAKRITASRRSVIDWELRRARPHQIYIERLTRLFKVPLDELDLKPGRELPIR